MRTFRTPIHRAGLAIAGLVLAFGWFQWLRPVTLGGDVAYVVVDGSSMEPTYDDGDLVLVRNQSQYDVGDVIAFRAGGQFDDPTRIIHRIVGRNDDGTFVTQGDNRDRTDPWAPGDDDIIGASTLHVPWAGSIAGFLTRPITFAALGAAAVIAGGERRRRKRSRHRRDAAAGPTNDVPPTSAAPTGPTGPKIPPRWARHSQPRWAFVGLVIAAVLALPVLVTTWSALRAPDATPRVDTVGRVDYGIDLDYVLSGEPSPVYPTGEIGGTRSGPDGVVPDGPLYSRLLDQIDLDLTFRADDDAADRLESGYRVEVEATTPDGYTIDLPSIATTEFSVEATERVTIDLRQVAFQVLAISQLTGIGGQTYTVTVTPQLGVSAAAASATLDDEITTPVTFTVDDNLISVRAVELDNSTPLTVTTTERATYALGPFDLDIQLARGVLGGLSLLLVAGIAWFASVLFGGLGLGESDRIAARYRWQMVDVSTATAPPGPVVMVSAIEELVRIAKVEQSVIIHEDLGDGAHRYRVFLGTVTYEYETAPEHGGSADLDLEATPDESGSDPT